MAWARLDDRFHEHWKVAEAGLEAVGLWTLCLTWANQARRTSPTPGVVPESVVARFAGGTAKGKRLAGRLHKVGMFDDKTPDGWPIHDFADYLAKYDPKQAAEAGRRGGEAKAKGTAKQTASKPPDETVAEIEQTSSTRASVRRDPVPVPSVPNGTGRQRPQLREVTDDEPPGAQQLVAGYVDLHVRRPPAAVVGQVAKQVGALLGEGFDADAIRPALVDLVRKRLHPSTLSSLVNEHANRPGVAPDGELSKAEVDEILGPDSETLPEPPIDPAVDMDGYRAWMRQAQAERHVERQRLARARLDQRVTT